MLMARDTPHVNLGMAKKTLTMPKWQLLGQSEFPSMGKSSYPTFNLWLNTAAWTQGRKLFTSGYKLPCRHSLGCLRKRPPNKAIYNPPHLPHLERVFSQKWNHIRMDVLGLLTIFIQPWSTL